MSACTDMCRDVPTLWVLVKPIISTYSGADIWDPLVCVNTGKHGDMCWHVPTCDIYLDTFDNDHLDLIQMLAYVSPCGHADMCWYMPACANMWNHSQHLWYQPFEPHLACWHVSATVDMTCADMCRHVVTCQHATLISTPLIDLIQMLACVSTCGHADMCWYVPTCPGMCQHVKPLSAPLIPTIGILSCMLACVSTFGHADMRH